MKKELPKALDLQTIFKEKKDDIIKTLIELYEFQENIKIQYSVKKQEA